jgi:hypothetical protein
MRLLTVLAVAALAAGLFHYRSKRKRMLRRPERQAASDQPIGHLGPMQTGIATGP